MNTTHTAKDIHFMQEAIELAKQGQYTARPNPCVGAVLVREGKIVGQGFHQYFGGAHAEIAALAQAGEQAQGATCYITLEPCSHQGKTGPCVDALIAAGVAQVIIADQDPNAQVNGKGIKKLQDNGIKVAKGLLKLQARALNPAFYHGMQQASPYVVLKSAMSLDARTAMPDGSSKWITGLEARSKVQELRAKADAIVTGIETVLADDPALTVRDEQFNKLSQFTQPKRVILDSQLRVPLNAKILQQAGETIVVTTTATQEKIASLQAMGVTVWQLTGTQIDLRQLLQKLYEAQCMHVLVEAGATLSTAFWRQGLVNEWHVFTAPKIMGAKARPVLDLDITELSKAYNLTLESTQMIGKDVYSVYKPDYESERELCLQD